MNKVKYNEFCKNLEHATHVFQWDADVWKIGNKVFAIGGWEKEGAEFTIIFKCSEIAFELNKDEKGVRPAPYLASRGLKWLQVYNNETFRDEQIFEFVKDSYKMIANALPKKIKKELGFMT